jgi:serine/threonine-protein kinase
MMVEHAKTEPTPPSTRTEIPVPEELDRILLKCLEKDPARRFQSARELSVALAECPVPEPWDEDRADKWWATHFPGVLGGAAPAVS